MPRRRRYGLGGLVLHVFNRSAGRWPLFETSVDYRLFEHVLFEACDEVPMRLLAYCLMPNHWHLLAWPRADGDLSRFMRWATATHAARWRLASRTVGEGVVYQGRYRAVPVQSDRHFITVARYIERNPVRAHLARTAADWPWSSAAEWRNPAGRPPLSEWPIPRPSDWASMVGSAASTDEQSTAEVRKSLQTSTPYGDDTWLAEIVRGPSPVGRRTGRRGRPRQRTVCRK